jgi:hypothetical protein
MKKTLFVLLAAIAALASTAQTNFSGGIYANTTWTKANSPYILTGSVVVFPGKTLTIQPGVVIRIQPNASNPWDLRYIEVRGKLIAQGTATDPIVFEGQNADTNVTWSGIKVLQSQGGKLEMNRFHIRNAWNGIDGDQTDSTRIAWNNCVFEYNQHAIRIAAPLDLTNCRFYNNTYGILGSNVTSNPSVVRSSLFRKSSCAIQGLPNFWVDQCVLDSNTTAFYFNSGYWYMPAKFTRNQFLHNFTAIMDPFQSQVRANLFDGNVIGINQCTDCTLDSNVFINNELGAGLYAETYFANNEVGANETGIVVGKALWPGSPGNPTVIDNRLCANTDYNVANGSNANLDLEANCFCLSDSASIDAKIYDGYDDITRGLINFAVYDTTCTTVMKRVVKVNTAGTDESTLKGFVYPNPAQESVGLEVSATEVVAVGADGIQRKLSPLDSEGRRWSVLDLPNGLYTIQAVVNGRTAVRTRLAVVH